jgi:hypothetical protein
MLKILAVLALLASPTLPAPSAIAQSAAESLAVTQDGAGSTAEDIFDYEWFGLLAFLSLLGIMRLVSHKRNKDTSVHFDDQV